MRINRSMPCSDDRPRIVAQLVVASRTVTSALPLSSAVSRPEPAGRESGVHHAAEIRSVPPPLGRDHLWHGQTARLDTDRRHTRHEHGQTPHAGTNRSRRDTGRRHTRHGHGQTTHAARARTDATRGTGRPPDSARADLPARPGKPPDAPRAGGPDAAPPAQRHHQPNGTTSPTAPPDTPIDKVANLAKFKSGRTLRYYQSARNCPLGLRPSFARVPGAPIPACFPLALNCVVDRLQRFRRMAFAQSSTALRPTAPGLLCDHWSRPP
jgi:hypothetical protein